MRTEGTQSPEIGAQESRKIPEVVHLLFATEKRISRAQQTAELPITVFIDRLEAPGIKLKLGHHARSAKWGFVLPRTLMNARKFALFASNTALVSRPRKSSYRSQNRCTASSGLACNNCPSSTSRSSEAVYVHVWPLAYSCLDRHPQY